MRRQSRSAAVIGLVLLAQACGWRDRERQIRTFADIRGLCRVIADAAATNGGRLTTDQAKTLIREASPRDAWGNEYLFFARDEGVCWTYVLVSPGDDAQLEVANIADFLSAPQHSIKGESSRDIVFRDGCPVTLAGK